MSDAEERNVISGNTSEGLVLYQSDDNKISGNLIGTDATGTMALGNATGVTVEFSSNNLIGFSNEPSKAVGAAEERNIISGNTRAGGNGIGVQVIGGLTNTISGNFIGTDITGRQALPNDIGIHLGATEEEQTAGPRGSFRSAARAPAKTNNGLAEAQVSDNFIAHNQNGIILDGGSPTLFASGSENNCIISNEEGTPGTDNGVSNLLDGVPTGFTNNWWGAPSGPSGSGPTTPGSGDEVSSGVTFDPFLATPSAICDLHTAHLRQVVPAQPHRPWQHHAAPTRHHQPRPVQAGK